MVIDTLARLRLDDQWRIVLRLKLLYHIDLSDGHVREARSASEAY